MWNLLLMLLLAYATANPASSANLRRIRMHNEYTNVTWKLGWNRYAHQTWETFFEPRALRYGFSDDPIPPNREMDLGPWSPPLRTLPSFWDWSSQLPPVRDQQACGSCWAFAATTPLEFLTNQTDLSEQQFMDCSRRMGNMGCRGGMPDRVYRYVLQQRVLSTETAYPYRANVFRCDLSRVSVPIAIRQIVYVFTEARLAEAVLRQPIPVLLRVTEAFHLYRSGIFDPPNCPTRPNHAVVLVGYGTSPEGIPYWIIRNSWGTSWGEQGYMRIRRGVQRCGLGTRPAPLLVI